MDTRIMFDERVSEVDVGSWWAASRVEEGWLGACCICRHRHLQRAA